MNGGPFLTIPLYCSHQPLVAEDLNVGEKRGRPPVHNDLIHHLQAVGDAYIGQGPHVCLYVPTAQCASLQVTSVAVQG